MRKVAINVERWRLGRADKPRNTERNTDKGLRRTGEDSEER